MGLIAYLRSLKAHHYAYIANTITISLVIVCVYWSFFPLIVFKFRTPIRILTEGPIHAGDVIQYRVDYCKGPLASDIVADVRYSLQDGVVYNIAGAFAEPLEIGCHVVTEAMRVPPEIPHGRYSLAVYRHYHLNPVRDVTASSISGDFEIGESCDGCVVLKPQDIDKLIEQRDRERMEAREAARRHQRDMRKEKDGTWFR